MRMFWNIVKYKFLSSIKHPAVLICLASAIVCSAAVGMIAEKDRDEADIYPIAIVDEDGGALANEFIEYITENEKLEIEIVDRNKAKTKVSTGKLDGAFIILDGFTEKIENGEIEDLLEFISPSVTTSAYPTSEIVTAAIVDIWLRQITDNKIKSAYDNLGNLNDITYEEIINKVEDDKNIDDIISIEYIGEYGRQYKKLKTEPIDKAVGVFAAFIIFAVILSSEWIFSIKNKALQERFNSNNSSMLSFYLATQFASVLVCIVFFLPLLLFLAVYLNLQIINTLYIFTGILIFSFGICAISFIISILVKNLTELIVLGVSIAISNILISSLITESVNINYLLMIISKTVPGTYLAECSKYPLQLMEMLIVSCIWIIIGYTASLKTEYGNISFS